MEQLVATINCPVRAIHKSDRNDSHNQYCDAALYVERTTTLQVVKIVAVSVRVMNIVY